MVDKSFIGIFDSGVGGLSVAKEIQQQLPSECLVYVADSGYSPYGEKSPEFIANRSLKIACFLKNQGAKAIVVACNTATAHSVEVLRSEIKLPVIGIEPGIKPAIGLSRSGYVGVIATEQTVKSLRFLNLVAQFNSGGNIEVTACPGLVEQVEALDLASSTTRELIKGYLVPLLDKGIDTLILGCTHYVFLKPVIKEVVGSNVEIVCTGRAVAKELARRLGEAELQRTTNEIQPLQCFTSGDLSVSSEVIAALWEGDIRVENLAV